MKRYGMMIGIKPEAVEKYKEYHNRVWPEVLQTIQKCNIRNYSIFLKGHLLFSYFEYHGVDFTADMALMAACPKTQEWWTIMEPLQQPLDDRAPGDWWTHLEEVFHTD